MLKCTLISLCVVQCIYTEELSGVPPLRAKTTDSSAKNGQEKEGKLQIYIGLLNYLDLQSAPPPET